MKTTFFLLSLLLLSACQTIGTQSNLRAFSLTDVRAAKVDADAHSDALASLCYGELITQLQVAEADPVGLVSTYQRARDVRRYAESDKLHTACGPLAVDAIMTLRSPIVGVVR